MEKQNTETLFDKKQIELMYENYKEKIINMTQEKNIQSFKENIFNLTELEILIARLEKYDSKSTEIKNKFNLYIETAKNVFLLFIFISSYCKRMKLD